MNMKQHTLQLGRKAARFDKRTLKLEKYISPNLVPPHKLAWQNKVADWRMFLNDSIGDCTCASAGHCIMDWTSNAGVLVTPPDSAILKAYEDITGYDPTDPLTDQGAVELDVLKYWQNTGIAGHKIGAYVSINPKNIQLAKIAIWLFGGVYTGVYITQADMDAVQAGQTTWKYTKGSPIGGHAIPALGYNVNGFQYITWGQVQTATYEWVYNRTEEVYAIVSQDWINNGFAPNGFNMTQLIADLAVVKS